MAGCVAVASAEGHHPPHFRFLPHAPVAVGRAQDSSQGLRVARIFPWDTLLSESDFPALAPSSYIIGSAFVLFLQRLPSVSASFLTSLILFQSFV